MTVEEAARIAGKSPQTIREGLKLGAFEFGTAFQMPNSTRYTYTIYPEKVYELYGRGEKNDEEVQN